MVVDGKESIPIPPVRSTEADGGASLRVLESTDESASLRHPPFVDEFRCQVQTRAAS